MTYTKVNYDAVESVADGLHFLREPLGTDSLGVSVLEVDAGWSGMEHDHVDDDQEEVYVLVEGSATVTVDGEDVSMQSGDALHLPPGATRTIEADDVDSTFVLVGAP